MEEISLNRKERERLFRKKEIIDAAVKIFAAKGFNSATLEDIAGSAEFGKGTLYNYFQGKEEIYRAIIDEVIINQEQIVKEADANSKSFQEFIEKGSKGIFEYCIRNKHAFLIFVKEIALLDRDLHYVNFEELFQKLSEMKRIFEKRAEMGIQKKEIRKVNPEKLLILYKHMLYPYIHHLIFCSGEEINVDEEISFFLSIFFEGIKNK